MSTQPPNSNTVSSRVPFETYVAIEAMNISRLKELARSGQHFQYRAAHPQETKPLSLGKAAHCAVLEPERFGREFAIWSRRSENTGNLCPRNGQWWDRFRVEHAGQSIINEDERDAALAIQQAVRADADAMRYLAEGDPEVVLEWTMGEDLGLTNRRCKGRVDWLTRIEGARCLVGLKTSKDCRPFIFGSQAAKLDYALQWAWYFDGYGRCHGEAPAKVVEIVVESAAPHAVVVYRIETDILLEGRDRYRELLKQLGECEASGVWPGPCVGEQVLSLPTWYYHQQDDLGDLGLEGL